MTAAQVLKLPSAAGKKVRQPALSTSRTMATLSEIRQARIDCDAIEGEILRLQAYIDGYRAGAESKIAELQQDLAKLTRARATAMQIAWRGRQ